MRADPQAGPRADHAARRDHLRGLLVAEDLDGVLLTAAPDVRYLTGFSGSNGQLVLGPDRAADRLVTDARYTARAAQEAPDLEVALDRDPLAPARALGRRIGVDADTVTWTTARRWRSELDEDGGALVALRAPVSALRAVKDAVEIASLAEACAITVTALEELFAERVHVGATERDLATWLERRFVDLGAEDVAFPSIVASGPNAAVPHHAPSARALVAGDLLTVDCGARVDGYHADCTRTVAVGHLDDQLASVHVLVQRAQAAGRAAATAGAITGAVDAAARRVIAEAGYGDRFVHGTGHGVGLEIHERPAVAAGASATLRPGTALTVEPGVYLPGVGGVRIEDTVVVTADGPPRVLTDTARELRVL